MSEPFLAEIKMVGFNFPPRGWATCDGQLLPIAQNQSLYALLGTTYGGDGRSTFALPDLRGRTPMHKSDSHRLGEKGGAESVTLTTGEMPAHNHGGTLQASTDQGNSRSLEGKVLAVDKGRDQYYTNSDSNLTNMGNASLSAVGGGQAHANVQPFQTLNFIIALQGLFPSRN